MITTKENGSQITFHYIKIIFQKKKKEEKWSEKIYQNILKARLSTHNLILT